MERNILDDQLKATTINAFFSDVGENLAKVLPSNQPLPTNAQVTPTASDNKLDTVKRTTSFNKKYLSKRCQA